jgi:glycolate oxidase subunit GlcD
MVFTDTLFQGGCFMPSLNARLSSLARLVRPEQLVTHPVELMTYEVDAGHDRGTPEAVVFPVSAQEVITIVGWAAAHGIPIVGRGAGTGLSGGAVAEKGGIIVEFSRMKKVLEFDAAGRSAVVEPGVVNLVLDELVKTGGLYYPPDPASGRSATLGGNVAENSGGPHCFKYGVTTNYITGLEVVLADGRNLRLGGQAMDYPEYDFGGLIVGSEGTLALVTRICVRLLRNPPALKTAMGVFDSVEQAGKAVSAVIAAGLVPATMEMMDQKITRIIEDYAHPGLPTDAGAILIIEVDGFPESLQGQMDEAARILSRNGGRDLRMARSADEREKIWYARKSAAGAMARLAPAYVLVDGTVPRSKLTEALQATNRICDKRDLKVGYVFHAGDGNLHPLFLMYPDDPEQVERVLRAVREFTEEVVCLGGSITGEHGVGIEKRSYMPLMYTSQEMMAMLDVKDVFDPHGLMNPGKIFPPLDATAPAGLEYGAIGKSKEASYNPRSDKEASDILRASIASGEGIRIRGGGSKSPWSPGEAKTLSTRLLKGIRTYAPEDLYVTVRAGMTLTELQAELAPYRMWVSLMSPWSEATIGGIVATNFNAPLRMRYGSIRDLVLDVTVATPGYELLHMGRPVVKNVAGYDMPKLFVGSYGTLGILTEVTLKLNPMPRCRSTLIFPVDNLNTGVDWGKVLLPVCLTASALALYDGSDGLTRAPFHLIYTAEGTAEDVEVELNQARSMLESRGATGIIEKDDFSGSEMWANWIQSGRLSSSQKTSSSLIIRVGVPPKNLPQFARDHSGVVESTPFFADFASGLLYLQLRSQEPISVLRDAALKAGGYAVVIAADRSHPALEPWGFLPESLDLMRRLKAKWDPRGLLNRGAFLF